MNRNIVYVRNTHIHDVCGSKDHCIIGTGEIDIPHYVTLLNDKDVIFIIEVRPGEAAVKSFINLREKLCL
jgi:sugar phosphate isomerase/epimerase